MTDSRSRGRQPSAAVPQNCLTLESVPGFILKSMSTTRTSFRSGEIARLTGVSADTIRHYERIGILPESARTASGYRMYAPGVIDRVQLVRRALQLGFTLTELAEILRVRDRGGVPCHRVLSLTEEKLRSLEQQIQELCRTQRYMCQLVRQWRRQLAHTPPGSKAMLLHSLADKPLPRKSGINHLGRRKRP
jgi:DNA-binding transcriptional MerR regulator